MSAWIEAGSILADELRRTGVAHGASADDRERLADQFLTALDAAGYAVVQRRCKEDVEPEPVVPPMIFAGASVTLDQLVPGRVVQRWTIQDGETVSVEPPCCAVLGRRIVLPRQEWHEEDVICQYDRLRYTVRLVDDNDEGLWAYLTVVGAVRVTKPRPPRRKARA